MVGDSENTISAPISLPKFSQQNEGISTTESEKGTLKGCVYSCRLCRTFLFHENEVLHHSPILNGRWEKALCTSYFVDPDVTTWVAVESRDARASGETVAPDTLYCPNPVCHAKLGTQSWAGTRCSCGIWVTPAFKILAKCVDRLGSNVEAKIPNQTVFVDLNFQGPEISITTLTGAICLQIVEFELHPSRRLVRRYLEASDCLLYREYLTVTPTLMLAKMSESGRFGEWPMLSVSPSSESSQDPQVSSYIAYLRQWMKFFKDNIHPLKARGGSGGVLDGSVRAGVGLDDTKVTQRDWQVCELNLILSKMEPSFAHTVASIWDETISRDATREEDESERWEMAVVHCVKSLCHGGQVAGGMKPDFPLQIRVKQALSHVMLNEPPAPEILMLDKEKKNHSLPTSTLSFNAVHLDEASQGLRVFPPALVLLLFHRHEKVRIWARESVLIYIGYAYTAVPRSLRREMPPNFSRMRPSLVEFSKTSKCVTHSSFSSNVRPQLNKQNSYTQIHDGGSAALSGLPLEKSFDCKDVDKLLLDHRLQALWRLSMELLCALKHLTQVHPLLLQASPENSLRSTQPSSHLEEVTKIFADGIYHLFVVLTTLDERITKMTSNRSAFLQTRSSSRSSQLPHPVTVLLLGGSMCLEWLFDAHEDLVKQTFLSSPTPSLHSITEHTEKKKEEVLRSIHFKAMSKLVEGVNKALRYDQTLHPISLAVEVKKSLAKVIIHTILDYARVSSESIPSTAPLLGSKAELSSRADKLRKCWWLAGALDAPPFTTSATANDRNVRCDTSSTSDVATSTAQRNCLYWILRPLLKNAHIQWGVDKVIEEALIPPTATSTISTGINASPRPTMLECTVDSYYLLFDALNSAMPDVVGSNFFHSVLLKQEQTVNALAVGGILHHANLHAVYLFEFLFRADFLAFSEAGRGWIWNKQESSRLCSLKRVPESAMLNSNKVTAKTKPLLCFQRVWTNYPIVLRHVAKVGVPSFLEQLIGVLGVFVNIPEFISRCTEWILLSPEDCGWPQPLGGVLKAFIGRLVEFFETHREHIKKKRVADDSSRVLSRLMTSASDIPSLVCRLQYAHSPSLRRLGELLGGIFLDTLGPTARLTFTSDAAQWMCEEVILLQEPLAKSTGGDAWLELHNARVDNLARQQGKQWLQVLAACNWSAMRTRNGHVGVASSLELSWDCTVVSAWWMVCLLADVVVLNTDEAVVLLKQVITELPPPPFSSLREDAKKLYNIVKHLFLCLLEKHVSFPQDLLISASLHVAGVLPVGKVEADVQLRDAVKHSIIVLLRQYLSKEIRRTLENYAPRWLKCIIQSATCALDASHTQDRRSFEQFEWKEKELARTSGAKKAQTACDAYTKQHPSITRTPEMETECNIVPPRDREINFGNQTSVWREKRSRKPPWMEDESDSDTSSVVSVSTLTVLPRSLTRRETSSLLVSFQPKEEPTFSLSSGTHLNAVKRTPTPQQRQLQAMKQQMVEKQYFTKYGAGLIDAMKGMVGRTTVLDRHTWIGDIIGAGSHCFAQSPPKIREKYVKAIEVDNEDGRCVSNTSLSSYMAHRNVDYVAARLYAETFVPHLALELRYGIAKDVTEWASIASKKGSIRDEKYGTDTVTPNDGLLRGCHINTRQRCATECKVSSNAQDKLSVFLTERYPLSRWVKDEALSVTHTGGVEGNALDPKRLNFTISLSDADNQNSSRLGEDDMVVVFLPLQVALAAWLRHRHSQQCSGSEIKSTGDDACIEDAKEVLKFVPERWRIFGCIPQVCYVSLVHSKGKVFALSCYPQETTVGSPHRHLHGNPLDAKDNGISPNARGKDTSKSSLARLLPFVHALRLGFKNSKDFFYIKWVGSMNPTISSLKALFGIQNTVFARTLYDPRSTSFLSQKYHKFIEAFFSDRQVMKYVKSSLVLEQLLNDSQAKAIASILYSVLPSWWNRVSEKTDPNSDKQRLRAKDNALPEKPLWEGATPEIHIVEGPPGTGKTQTISLLILNLLYYLVPKRHILLCAPSNSAVDEALLRVHNLQKQLELQRSGLSCNATISETQVALLRVGSRPNVSKDVLKISPPLFLEDKVEEIKVNAASAASSSLKEAFYGRDDDMHQKLIESCPVIFTTLGSIHQLQRSGYRFDVVIVDEVSQATEPSLLQALMCAKGKCVLVGDWKQLQPTVLSPEAASCGLQQSVIEKLLRAGHQSHFLRTQYRMHPDICAFPNYYFYENKLQTDDSVLQRQNQDGSLSPYSRPPCKPTIAQKLRHAARLAFVDVSNGVMRRGYVTSWCNPLEAQAVVRAMREIRDYFELTIEEAAKHIGIITYYTAQQYIILQALNADEKKSGIQIATVDSFQGKEKDIILISCVRTNTKLNTNRKAPRDRTPYESGKPLTDRALESEPLPHACSDAFSAEMGFLSNWHRINVSLTRAKELCIVFGHRATLEGVARMEIDANEKTTPEIKHRRKCRGTTTTADSVFGKENIPNLNQHDDPAALGEFIRHVRQHDSIPHEKTDEEYRNGGNQGASGNAAMGISSDSSVEEETVDPVCDIDNRPSHFQAVYLTYNSKKPLMARLLVNRS